MDISDIIDLEVRDCYNCNLNHILENDSITKNKLFISIKKYLSENVIGDNVIVSLSGGVDSMVLISLIKLTLMHFLMRGRRIGLIAIHINYCNRTETIREEMFLEEWCKINDIVFKKIQFLDLQRNTSERDFYERETRHRRFNFYRQCIMEHPSSGIFLAHHKGDEQENTFSNIINGKNILNLAAMSESSEIDGVIIHRPLIEYEKKYILDFAKTHKIPYFNDTTPDWSNRGKLRRQIFPLLEEVYGTKYLTNMSSISQESLDWKNIVQSKLITPFVNNSINYQTDERGVVQIIISNLKEVRANPYCFWDIIFKTTIQKANWDQIAKKAVQNLTNKLNTNFVGQLPLSKSINCQITSDSLVLKKVD